jgi:hypothetical protein
MSIKQYCKSITPVGSSITCDPPVLDTDRDFLVLAKEGELQLLYDALTFKGWATTSIEEYASNTGEKPFRSYRKGKANYIVTDCKDYHKKFMYATYLAKRFNLLHKADRVDLFNCILYGVPE